MQPQQQTQRSAGTLKRGWLLTKASWQVLRQDKSLMTFPILNVVISGLLLLFIGAVGYFILTAVGGNVQSLSDQYDATNQMPTWFYLLLALYLVPLFMIMNFFTACVTAGALQRFRGQDPTVGSSLKAVDKISGKIIEFSLYQNGAIWGIDLLSRTPIVGGALAFLGEMAFTVGSFFALPVMIDNPDSFRPFGAIKRSTQIIRKVWGESIVIALGMPLIAVLAGVAYTIVWGLVLVLITPAVQNVVEGHEIAGMILGIGALALGYGLIMIIYSALSAIVTTALYLYATTGQAPSEFDTGLLEQMVRPKTSSDL